MRRRLLEDAVADNFDTIRGLPPRALRRSNQMFHRWLRWSPVLLIAFTLTASTYFIEPKALPSPGLRPPSPANGKEHGEAGVRVELPTPDQPEPPQRVAAAAFPLAVRRVVLDFGHGGMDPGASFLGLAEKDVTLDIGRRLRTLLQASGFEVMVTRPDDRTIRLRERARLANDSRSDVFVSIHVNSLMSHTSSHGVETYYLGPTSDPKLTQLAAEENSMSGYSMADLRKLLDGVYADARRDESRQLAKTVQQQLYSRLRNSDPGLENWGVKRAPFVVLVATDMPAILAEVGCISNDKEAAMLGKADYRQKIAEALFQGIHAYAGAAESPQKKGT
ncbi:MAG TPA: N-acetylmuramoyl-L-alanine amidase [Thermoanaerobaculia bacterium]|nr:N-acetylmuramoyl-L-alanine amidase [Thermoanaerobaculia bacterium]